jgi:hypothetical protein
MLVSVIVDRLVARRYKHLVFSMLTTTYKIIELDSGTTLLQAAVQN